MGKSARGIIESKRDELKHLQLFAHVCLSALDKATMAVKQVELSKKISELLGDPPAFPSDEHFEKAKARAGNIASFAAAEKENGFPQLYGVLVVRLWTVLEALVDELVVEALMDSSSCGEHPTLSKLKGPLIEFRRASPEEQAEFLADTIKQTVDSSLKSGVGRFEAILDPIGLGGSIDDGIRKVFFELSHVRNVVVHKNGMADRRLVESCPWINAQRGNLIPIDAASFDRYLSSSYWYLLELRARIDERAGEKRNAKIGLAQEDLRKAIDAQVGGVFSELS